MKKLLFIVGAVTGVALLLVVFVLTRNFDSDELGESLLAKVSEAETFASEGFEDIRVAYDVVGAEKLERLERSRLARECAKLDPIFEKGLAEEGVSQDLAEWPEY